MESRKTEETDQFAIAECTEALKESNTNSKPVSHDTTSSRLQRTAQYPKKMLEKEVNEAKTLLLIAIMYYDCH